ncbi:MAG: transcriptional regulator [Bacteroidales bacterium]|jgi:predicted transcriptional regulator|nr:transcriptional regulator [Bacteroidales bacterium]
MPANSSHTLPSLDGLNKAFESKARLGIMSVLMVNESADFATLKQLLSLTDGNLASHTRALEELGYIQCEKRFIGRKPNTSFSVTQAGSQAFKAHLKALELFVAHASS